MYAPAEPRIVQVYPVRRRFSGVTPAILGEGVARGKGVKPFPTCLLCGCTEPVIRHATRHFWAEKGRPTSFLTSTFLRLMRIGGA